MVVTFDFDDLPAAETNGALASNGFVFDPGDVDWYPEWTADSGVRIGHHHIADTSAAWGANNGTQYLVIDYFFDKSWLHIYGDSGQTFGVQQLDLAENAVPGVCHSGTHPSQLELNCGLTFLGQLAGGGTISRHVTLDAITDGAGPLGDFQTLVFDAQWNELEMFSLIASEFYLNPGLDNFTVRTVPEPSSLGLLVVGIAGLLSCRRRRRRSPAPTTAHAGAPTTSRPRGSR